MVPFITCPWLEYRHATPDGNAVLRLRTGRGEFARVVARTANHYNFPDPFGCGQDFAMTVAYRDDLFDFYEVSFHLDDPRFRYLFILYADGDRTYKLDASGLRAGADGFDDISESFAFAYAYPTDPMPEWARGVVGYQIFPDRFRPRRCAGRWAGALEQRPRIQRVPLRRQLERHPRRYSIPERARREDGIHHTDFFERQRTPLQHFRLLPD